jgi:hypothetical protein
MSSPRLTADQRVAGRGHLVCPTNCIRLRPVRCSGGQQGTSSAQITWLIANGQLEPGDRLPTVRRLAEHLSINLHTVRSAYQEAFDGLIPVLVGRMNLKPGTRCSRHSI